MKVELLGYTPEPEILSALSAATSFKEEGASLRKEKMTPGKARKILKRVMSYGHVSVIEHASFTFSLEGVSRALTHQLVRHRIASFTQQSQRYVKITTDNDEWYVIPPKYKDKKMEEFKKRMKIIAGWYQEALEKGLPSEDARFYLPNACKTNIVVTMNARELLHFFKLRCCARCQWELRNVAKEMLKKAKKVSPIIFENAGPSCVALGYCPERELKPETCNIVEIKKKFLAL
ncbi:MAG: FAD-dependent thymidylate synthase [Candidatus Aenigmatarchaeota archaeon]